MGVLYTFWLIGMGLGPVTFNFLIDWSYQFSFWILVILWGIGWAISLKISNQRIALMENIPFLVQLKLLWERLKTMRALLPGMVLQTTAAGMLVPILPHFATKNLGLTYSQYSFVLMTGGVSAVIGLIPMGKFADKWGRKWFLVLGFGIFAIVLYSLAYSRTFYISLLWAMVLGISYSAVLPAWKALLSHFVPNEQQGMGWGIFSSVEGIGVILGPVLGGWIASGFNYTITVLVSATLLALISIFYLFMPISSKSK
jgi:MFS family permease